MSNDFYKHLNPGDIIKRTHDMWAMCIQTDYATRSHIFQNFASYEAAETFVHDFSLKQHPKWHAESCPRCKGFDFSSKTK